MDDNKKVRGYRLSLKGIELAKKARGRLTVDDFHWLLEASKIVEPEQDWTEFKGYYAYNISEGTWKRFLYGGSVNYIAFDTYCKVLDLEFEDVIENNKFDWLENLPQKDKKIFKKDIKEINDINKKLLFLSRSFINREIEQVSQINDINKFQYLQFIEEIVWTMRQTNSSFLQYIDVIKIANKFFSPITLEKKFPFPGMMSIKGKIINGEELFNFQNSHISDYIIAQTIIYKIRDENLDLLTRLQTSYYEDMFIAQLINEGSNNLYLLDILKKYSYEKSSKTLSVNIAGILSKSLNKNNIDFIHIQSIINFVFANSDVMELYSSAVFQRILGNNYQENIISSTANLRKLENEVKEGLDPIAIIFCLKMLSSQKDFSDLLKIFSSRYGSICEIANLT